MDKDERGRALAEAVLTLDPKKIREVARITGHDVTDLSDREIQIRASEMIIFGMPNAPKEAVLKAISTLSSGRFSFKYY